MQLHVLRFTFSQSCLPVTEKRRLSKFLICINLSVQNSSNRPVIVDSTLRITRIILKQSRVKHPLTKTTQSDQDFKLIGEFFEIFEVVNHSQEKWKSICKVWYDSVPLMGRRAWREPPPNTRRRRKDYRSKFLSRRAKVSVQNMLNPGIKSIIGERRTFIEKLVSRGRWGGSWA